MIWVIDSVELRAKLNGELSTDFSAAGCRGREEKGESREHVNKASTEKWLSEKSYRYGKDMYVAQGQTQQRAENPGEHYSRASHFLYHEMQTPPLSVFDHAQSKIVHAAPSAVCMEGIHTICRHRHHVQIIQHKRHFLTSGAPILQGERMGQGVLDRLWLVACENPMRHCGHQILHIRQKR